MFAEAHDWKRAFNDKEDELQEVQLEAQSLMADAEQMRRDADRDLAQGLRTVKQQQEQLAAKDAELKSLKDAMEPLLELIPEDEGGEVPLLERIKSAPSQLTRYITEMSQSIVKVLLSILHVHLPQVDLGIVRRRPRGCTDEDLTAAEERVEEIANAYAEDIKLLG